MRLHMNTFSAHAHLLAASGISWPVLAPVAWLLVVIVSFFFFVVRPQRRKFAEQQQVLDALTVGDKVVTTSGILGVVRSLEDDTVTVTVAEGVDIVFAKGAILDRREDVE